ncbi:unnamed protein product, partial [Brassica rapa]
MFRFSKKLKALKPLIRELGQEKLGNLSKRAKVAHDILCDKQNQTLLNPSSNIKKEAERFFSEFLNQIPGSYQGASVE